MKLRFTHRALEDLARLRAFIAKDNPPAARRISQAIMQSIRHLLDHPKMGYLLDNNRLLRRWIAGDYVVHYLSDEKTVTVLRTWHGKEERLEN